MKEEYNSLLESIKQDNLILFSTSIKNNKNISFGRFPILSLCYLYNANKILKNYKQDFDNISNYKIVEEPFEVYKKFKNYAGRALRLYLNGDIVTPLEMLAILHNDALLKKEYITQTKSQKQIDNLKSIYRINKQKIELDENSISIEKSSLNTSQMRFHKITLLATTTFITVICFIFIVSSIITGFGVGNSPFYVYNQTQLLLALKSNKNYVIKNDITLTNTSNNLNFYGSLDGGGFTIYIQNVLDDYLVNNNFGIIKNLKICYGNVTSKNQNQNEINKTISTSTSLLVNNNSGTIQNVDIKTSKLNITFSNSSNIIFFNGFATTNNGTVKNCTISSNVNLVSKIDKDCFFSGFVGNNYATVENCVYNNSCSITTNEVDASGIVNINNIKGLTNNCKNYADISQTSNRNRNSPNASGIAIHNYSLIKNCYNFGNIKITSNNDNTGAQGIIFVGGICAENYSNILKCLNKGQITAFSKRILVYAGGISAISLSGIVNNFILSPTIKDCGVNCTIDVKTEDENASEEKFTLASAGAISGRFEGIYIDDELYRGVLENCYTIVNFKNVYDDYAEIKYSFSSCIGVTTTFLLSEPFNPINNYCLIQNDVPNKIGGLVYNGILKRPGELGIDIESRYADGIMGYETPEDIMNLEVYWSE